MGPNILAGNDQKYSSALSFSDSVNQAENPCNYLQIKYTPGDKCHRNSRDAIIKVDKN